MKGKKVIALLVAASMAVQAVGCGNTNQSGTDKNDNPVEESSREAIETDVLEASRCNTQPNEKEENDLGTSQEKAKESAAEITGTYEAEEAQLKGNVKASEGSGDSYVAGFENDGDSWALWLISPQRGFMISTLSVRQRAAIRKTMYQWMVTVLVRYPLKVQISLMQ